MDLTPRDSDQVRELSAHARLRAHWLLSAAGEWRWAQWRKDQAWARLQSAMVVADTAGIPKKVIGEIAGVRRGAAIA